MQLKTFFLVSAFISFNGIRGQQIAGPVKVTDLLKIKSIGGLSLNKDGSRAVFTVTSIEQDGDNKWEYKYVNQVWMVGTEGESQPRQLTYKESTSQPSWSPDGTRLAMVRNVEGKPQVFLLPLEGGEAVQLTSFKYGASSPKWSPDGKQILFSSGIPLNDLLKDSTLNPKKEIPKWPFEKPGFPHNENLRANSSKGDPDGNLEEVRAWLKNNEADKKAKVLDKLQFQEEAIVSSEISFNHYFIVDAKPGAQPKSITQGFYRFNGAEFSNDGKFLIISGDIDSLEHPDCSLENEIFLVNTDGSEFRVLLSEEGKVFANPRLSPSGKWISFTYGGTSFVTVPELAIMPLSGTAKDMITIPFDRNKNNFLWSSDEKYLYFTAPSNGGLPL